MRRARAVVVAVLLLAVFATVNASSASADWWNPLTWTAPRTDCKNPPWPDSPNKLGDTGPAKPADGDPFDPNSGTTLYDKYGLGGFQVNRYDQGNVALQCANPNVPVAIAQSVTDFITGFIVVVTAVVIDLWRWVTDGSLTNVLTPMQAALTAATGKVFLALAWLPVTLMGLWWLWKAKSLGMAEAAGYMKNVVLIIVAVTVAMTFTFTAGAMFIRGMNATLAFVGRQVAADVNPTPQTAIDAYNNADTSNAADVVGDLVTRQVLYPMWANQTFGDAETAAQAEFGPRLYAAGTLSRVDHQAVQEHPERQQEVIGGQVQAYTDVATQIEQRYKSAYMNVTGNGDSFGALFEGVLAAVAVLIVAVFLLAALWEIAAGMVAIVFTLGVLPVVGLVSIHPAGQPLFFRLCDWVKGRVVKAAVSAVGVFLFVSVALGPVLKSTLPVVGKFGLLAVAAVVMWRLQKLGLGNIKGTHKRFRKVKKGAKKTVDHTKTTVENTKTVAAATGRHAATAGHVSWSAAKGAGRGAATIGGGAATAAKTVTGRASQPANRRQAATAGAKQGATQAAVAGAVSGGTVTAATAAAGAVKGAVRGAARRPAATNGQRTPVSSPVQPGMARRDHWHAKRAARDDERIAVHAPVEPR